MARRLNSTMKENRWISNLNIRCGSDRGTLLKIIKGIAIILSKADPVSQYPNP
jgi:hypothetical protein